MKSNPKVMKMVSEMLEKVEKGKEIPEKHFYAKWIGDENDGRWNIIQVQGDVAHYLLLETAELTRNAKISPFKFIGYIEDGWYTDGEDYTSLNDWELYKGILVDL